MSPRRIARPSLLLGFIVLVVALAGLALWFRARADQSAAQLIHLQAENQALEQRLNRIPPVEWSKPSTVFKEPVTSETALSLFWFGDMESHFRNPVDFHVVANGDPSFHKVQFTRAGDNVNIYISADEMTCMLAQLQALNLIWSDAPGREPLVGSMHRLGSDTLDITLVGSHITGKTHIRVAMMCPYLAQLDATMPAPRIRWQFQTFRGDNGCVVDGYINHEKPSE